MAVDAAAFIPPAFILHSLYLNQNDIPALSAIPEHIGQVIGEADVPSPVFSDKMPVDPNRAQARSPIEGDRPLTVCRIRGQLKGFTVKPGSARQIAVAAIS
ncbi:hypothetical protein D3C75_994830 [compost metagenome]